MIITVDYRPRAPPGIPTRNQFSRETIVAFLFSLSESWSCLSTITLANKISCPSRRPLPVMSHYGFAARTLRWRELCAGGSLMRPDPVPVRIGSEVGFTVRIKARTEQIQSFLFTNHADNPRAEASTALCINKTNNNCNHV
jgi:hypothetical protein